MRKVQPPDGYPPEEDQYLSGNDYSPVAVCVIADTSDFVIPAELNELLMAGLDSGPFRYASDREHRVGEDDL